MKIVVIGGTGLIGSKTVAILRQGGHEVLAAGSRPSCSSPSLRTTLLPALPMWRSRRRTMASLRSPARNERRSTKSSPAI